MLLRADAIRGTARTTTALNRDDAMSTLGKRLIRTLYPYGKPRRVLRGPGRGLRFVVEPGIGFTYAVATEAACSRELLRRIKPGSTVFDLGANKGQMTLLFSRLVGREGAVISMEPAPREFASLQRNIALNRLGNVQPIQAAAADRSGTLVFTYDPNRPTQGKLNGVEETYRREAKETFEVSAIPLDELVRQGKPEPDFIKVDVEGAARSVFAGAGELLDRKGPAIYVELHGPEEQAGVRDELLSRGYVAETLDGRRVDDPTATWVSPLWCYRPDGDRSR